MNGREVEMMEGVERRRGLYGFEFLEPDGRRADPEERKTPEIKSLWQRTHEIINLAAKGWKQVEIAEILRLHPQTVSNTLNSELGMKKLSEIREEKDQDAKKIIEKINVLTNKAIGVYNDLFDSETTPDDLKKKTADTVMLELSGLRVPTKVMTAGVHAVATLAEIEEFKKRGIEAAHESGMIVVVEDEGKGRDNGGSEDSE